MLCCIVFSYHQLQPGCCCLNRIRYNTPTAQACRSLLGARDWIWRFFVTSLVARANNIPNLRCKALPLLPRKRPQRQVSAKHSMLMSVGYGGPASGQTEKLWSATNQTQTWGQGGPFVCFLELRLSPKAWPSCCSTDEQCSEISTARSRVPGALHPEQDLEPWLSPTPYPPEPEQPPTPPLSPPPQATLPLLRHCRTHHPPPVSVTAATADSTNHLRCYHHWATSWMESAMTVTTAMVSWWESVMKVLLKASSAMARISLLRWWCRRRWKSMRPRRATKSDFACWSWPGRKFPQPHVCLWYIQRVHSRLANK